MMDDDQTMADLLGEAPKAPDPNFRLDVFARIAVRARRRAAARRAVKVIAAFAAFGLLFPLARALGLTLADAKPVLLAAGVLGLAGALALVTIEGPGALLSRSRAILRARVRAA